MFDNMFIIHICSIFKSKIKQFNFSVGCRKYVNGLHIIEGITDLHCMQLWELKSSM